MASIIILASRPSTSLGQRRSSSIAIGASASCTSVRVRGIGLTIPSWWPRWRSCAFDNQRHLPQSGALRQLSLYLSERAAQDFLEFFRELAGYGDAAIPPERLHLLEKLADSPRRLIEDQCPWLILQLFEASMALARLFRQEAFEHEAIGGKT